LFLPLSAVQYLAEIVYLMSKPQILLTNDDGIRSPGLWAAAEALSTLGYVTVVAPREQSSGTGRSLPISSDGIIEKETLTIRGQTWTVYAVGGTPAQAVLHGILEIMPTKPDLVVSGINYGENVATGITVSGTVGAAMEAASHFIPALAVSLETDKAHHLSYSPDVDFSAAAHFTAQVAERLLQRGLPPGADLLKIDVPSDATPATPLVWTRLSRQRYFHPTKPERSDWSQRGAVGYEVRFDLTDEPQDTDACVVMGKRQVSLTPLSLDFTARTPAEELAKFLS
jgi:5'-nucleotidase